MWAVFALSLVVGAGARPALASSILLNETFKTSTARGWTLAGQARLTSGTVDPSGDGWLRLTGNTTNQTGFAYLNDALPFSYGLDIRFQYSVWGGTGADGFALVMFDGDVTPTSAGAYGGSLGYAQHGSARGLQGAILGIGFDEFGNFANPTEGRQGGPGFTKDSITIRGPGDGTSNALTPWGVTNYGFIATTGDLPGNAIQVAGQVKRRPTGSANYREAEVIVDTTRIAEGKLPITVLLQAGTDGTKVVVANYDAYKEVIAYYGSAEKIPQTMKFGFTGSTGGLTDYHEIRGLEVLSVQNAPGYATVAPEASTTILMLSGFLLIAASGLRRKGAKQ